MKYNIDYNICSLALLMVILLLILRIRTTKNQQNKIYTSMVVLLVISTVCSTISGFAINHQLYLTKNMLDVVNYIYHLTRCTIPFIFYCYVVLISSNRYDKNNIWNKILVIPVITTFLIVLVNPIFHIIFKINEEQQYIRQNGIYIIYINAFIYYVACYMYVIWYRKAIDLYKKTSILISGIILLVVVIYQLLIPTLLIESFGISLSVLLIYTGIQKSEEYTDGNIVIYNKKAFISTIKINLRSNVNFTVISVSIDEYDNMERMFGVDAIVKVEKELGRYLYKLDKNYNLYYISDYVYYLVVYKHFETVDATVQKIAKDCDTIWRIGEVDIPIDVDICVINCPQDVNHVEQIFECSEFIMREKHGKESRIVYANDLNAFYGKRKREIQLAIKKAIENDSFNVYFQPIYSTKQKRVNSAEALVRLYDEHMGFISPEEFIPIAEEDGTILKIGNYVLETVCRFLKDCEIAKCSIEYIEVNISVIEGMKQDMSQRVLGLIKKYGLKPNQINLEITETAALNSPDILGINMSKLINEGVSFSLDDYGSGYSNINYLAHLPFSLIKVDKNIVWSSFENRRAQIVLENSIKMIQELNYHIVAEGIETAEQAKKLEEMGCKYLQGYYFAKPMCQEDFIEYLKSQY